MQGDGIFRYSPSSLSPAVSSDISGESNNAEEWLETTNKHTLNGNDDADDSKLSHVMLLVVHHADRILR